MKVKALVAVLGLFFASSALGYEYHLQYSVPPRAGYATDGLDVIGNQFNSDGTVSGAIYYFQRPCGVRYCGAPIYYELSGTWDAQGNLISSTQVASQSRPFTIPPAQYFTSASTPTGTPANTESVYAVNGTSTAGHDTRGFGYVDVQSAHFTWQTTNNAIYVIPYAPDSFQVQLASDGDLPLDITSTVATITFNSYYDNGTGTVTVTATGQTNDCLSGPVQPGTSCVLNVTYDPTTIKCTTSPYGYAYNHISLGLASDAENLPEWLAKYTITGVPMCEE